MPALMLESQPSETKGGGDKATQASYLMGNWELAPEVSPAGCGCESLCVEGRGIRAGFAEEETFGLGFEA